MFFLPINGFTQIESISEKYYAVEGVISEKNNQAISFMVFKNDKLGISAISDERGYFLLSFSMKLLKDTSVIEIDMEKPNYKKGKIWISYNPSDSNSHGNIIWQYSLKFIRYIVKNSDSIYQESAHRRINNSHGYSGILNAYKEDIESRKRSDAVEQLMQGNENVLFFVDNQYILTVGRSIVWLNKGQKLEIYFKGQRIKLKEANKILKRSEVIEDKSKRKDAYQRPGIYRWYLIESKEEFNE